MSFETHNDSIGSASDLEPAVPGPIESSLLVEQESIGDWAGHTPTPAIDAEIAAGQEDLEADARESQQQRKLINWGVQTLVTISGENSRDHGFHDDWPTDEIAGASTDPEMVRAVGLAITEKLALIHEEISESLGEIRSGRDPLESYFVDKKGVMGPAGFEYSAQYYGQPGTNRHPETFKRDGDIPLLKPEGFVVELADAMIRIADLAYLVGGRSELVEALAVKHEYNATRPYKHGRKF